MASEPPIQLGPFLLGKKIGEGGMGLVFEADHSTRDQPVAIKVMTSRQAQRSKAHRAFRREVQAIARLNHRHIIRIFDTGKIPIEADRRSSGTLLTGSPYLLMERADSSLLALNRDELTWPHIQTILHQVLDALAHSHAQGLIHRDLKPGNILVTHHRDRFRLVLTDFGIAHAIHHGLDDSERDEDTPSGERPRRIIGTPRYMAPEQIQGQPVEQGPWTDLYAVGCLAHWLCCGVPPFSGPTREVLKNHCQAPRPPLMARIAVPRGFQAWVARLMAPDTGQRFRRAADAAVALDSISPRSEADPEVPVADGPPHPSRGTPSTLIVTEDPTIQIDRSPPPLPSGDDVSSSTPTPADQLPSSWRDLDPQPAPMELDGVGLGLFGLRPPPLVGRKYERDHLWQVLVDSIAIGRPHGAVLTGPAGIGKSRLAWWLATRAHELGAANVLQVSHNPTADPAEGLRRLFATHLRADQRPLPELIESLRLLLGDDRTSHHTPLALATLLQQPERSGEMTRFNAREERFALWQQLLRALARRRPVILLADDIQWGHETLAFLDYLFADDTSGDPLPLSMIITARDEDLHEQPRVQNRLQQFHRRPWVHHLPLEALDTDAHRRLITSLIQLHAQVQQKVIEQTRGNPLFAIQLLGDWIHHGRLQPGDDGFALRHQPDAELPASIHQLLIERLRHVLDMIDPESTFQCWEALELAAVFGRQVQADEWSQALAEGELSVPPDLLEELGAQGLVEARDDGFRFTQGAMRESLLRSAEEAKRLPSLHHHCARALRSTYEGCPIWLSPRLAHHLLSAGDDEAALDALLDASRYYQIRSQFDDSLQSLSQFDDARQRVGLGDDDPRVLTAWLERARTDIRQLNIADAQALLHRCRSIAQSKSSQHLVARCELNLARAARLEGQVDAGFEHGQRALELFESLDDQSLLAETLYQLSWLYRWRGQLPKALHCTSRALDIMLDIAPDSDRHARVQNLMGILLINMERFDEGLDYTQRALETFEAHGNISAQVGSLNNLGEMTRLQGQLDEARQYYDRACKLARKLRGQRDRVSRINLALIDLETGHHQRAYDNLSDLNNKRQKQALRGGYHLSLEIGLLCASAGLRHWSRFDDHLQVIQSYDVSTFVDRDLAQALDWSAEHCREAGEHKRSQAASDLARAQWKTLNAGD